MTEENKTTTAQPQPEAKALANPATQLKGLLDKAKKEIEAALPKHMTADRMLRIAMTEVRKNPALLECDKASFIGAIIQASQLGLEPGSALGHCYLIPFYNGKKGIKEVQFMPGYRGFLDLARRSKQVMKITARVVREGDEFGYEYGMEETLTHRPGEDNEDGKITHVYAVAFLSDGTKAIEVMTIKQIEKIRQKSKSGDYGPWKEHYEEMARKTVIRKIFKYLPVSIEIQQAVGYDEAVESGISQENDKVIELEESEPTSTGERNFKAKAARSTDQVKRTAEANVAQANA